MKTRLTSRVRTGPPLAALGLCLLAQFIPAARAVLSEPDNRVWGQIVLGAHVVTAAQTNIVVEARKSLNTPPIASYRMGQKPAYGDFYSLAIPLESVTPLTETGSTRTGEQIIVLVHNGEFVRYLTLYTVGSRGRMMRLDLGDIDGDSNGLVDNWERQFFGSDGQDPNGDPDRDGVRNRDEMLGGTHPLFPDARHPADINPTNNVVTIHEVTAYALAWKTGQSWPVAPTNIPVDFVARAGFLWKSGERYGMNTNALDLGAPLWWTNRFEEPGLAAAADGGGDSSGLKPVRKSSRPASHALSAVELPGPGKISRSLQAGGELESLVSVALEVLPAFDVSAYVVEETIPDGWTVGTISDEGTFDAASRKVRWGLFFDDQKRALSYALQPSGAEIRSGQLTGLASFDGQNVVVEGERILKGPGTLEWGWPAWRSDGQLTFQLQGQPGRLYDLEESLDLIEWRLLQTLTSSPDGTLEWSEPVSGQFQQRFFRARERVE